MDVIISYQQYLLYTCHFIIGSNVRVCIKEQPKQVLIIGIIFGNYI